MPTKAYEQIRGAVLDGAEPPANLTEQLISLTPNERSSLAKLLSAVTNKGQQGSLKKEVLESLSALQSSSAQRTASGPEMLRSIGLALGDVVRSNDQHWLKTGEHLTGKIVGIEQVPESQVPVVGSRHWVYLSSGEGPISTAILEKVVLDKGASEDRSLENLREILGTSRKVQPVAIEEPAESLVEVRSESTVSETVKG
jgi:hypothetical protein